MDATGICIEARARLSDVRVEVDTDPAEAPGLPWDLLRDPGTDTPLAVAAGEFVCTHLQTAGRALAAGAAGDELRVLLVICRPGRPGRCAIPVGGLPAGPRRRARWTASGWTCCGRPPSRGYRRCCTKRPMPWPG